MNHIEHFRANALVSNALIGPYTRRGSSALSRVTFLISALIAIFIGAALGFAL